MTQTLGQAWRTLRDRLAACGIASAALDARLLVRHVLDLDEMQLIAREGDGFPQEKHAALEAVVVRREQGEPLARILGTQEFYGLSFGLNAATLIPRPETEMLVDHGLGALAHVPTPRILDLGTGTGCIALSLLANSPNATALGIDLAPEALVQARANATALGLSDRFEARQGDWFSSVGDAKFDLIVSNPPYIASAVINTLEIGVRAYDPMGALDGGADGAEPYRIIANDAPGYLRPNGFLILEIGFDQAHIVSALLKAAGFSDIAVSRDLAGHDRMVSARAHK
ncbi:peptide chain release factor N(5)-glutamine methyltransferase [Pelagibacterium luteolum]|uniref:Release factor glutamine methyltransferase n=1 Tax=Pelagibacterium luteolum TaxID=440168 RepID=A0A1G7RNC5_9HYPH|nr:peptide chain release factor N(5)-glutamine methyltransferase [Pelagibacterium luteolum]SDG12257.1 release factor glutamine methyltransferase [Pelagibacterium luteolum]